MDRLHSTKTLRTLINLIFHKQDFDIQAEWHFFATSPVMGLVEQLNDWQLDAVC